MPEPAHCALNRPKMCIRSAQDPGICRVMGPDGMLPLAKGVPMPVYALGEHEPQIHPDAYVHPDAVVIGRVSLGPEATVWPGAVLRGDYGRIDIGSQTSIQDGTVIHATETLPTSIGDRCVVGHNAHLEGCVVEHDVLVGSGSVLLHRVIARSGCLIAAGAVVTPGTEIPSRALAAGVPAVVKADRVDPADFAGSVQRYIDNGKRYAADLRQLR
jgi:carbonic anhydrase/acetyltransferase-like protein (isoleucine patch superfamily)